MAMSIPYDPTLVLGNIVDRTKIESLKEMASKQKPMKDAQAKLDALILSKRSLDMTMQEMINMNVSAEKLTEFGSHIDKVKDAMADAASDLAAKTVEGQEAIAEYYSNSSQREISDEIESPLDYNKSAIRQMAISSDSLTLDAQYFRHESNSQSARQHANSIGTYVSAQVSSIFGSRGVEAASAVNNLTARQAEEHELEGTLVITANCTHKNADIFAPFIIDVEKGIRAWNEVVKTPFIDMDDKASVAKIANDRSAVDAQMHLLSGATYGSSFVGLVHVVRTEGTSSYQAMTALTASLQATMSAGGWFAKSSGEFGVNASFADSVKQLLSTSNLSSHCSLVTMGVIPTIKSNNVETVIKKMTSDPKEHMEQLAAIQGATNDTVNSMASASSSAADAKSMVSLSSEHLKAAVSSVGDMDRTQNAMINTNSLMEAFDNYVERAAAGECGIPINFFLKPITARQLAKAWVHKYYPGEFTGAAPAGDDPQ